MYEKLYRIYIYIYTDNVTTTFVHKKVIREIVFRWLCSFFFRVLYLSQLNNQCALTRDLHAWSDIRPHCADCFCIFSRVFCEEVMEFVDFLQSPTKYQQLGGGVKINISITLHKTSVGCFPETCLFYSFFLLWHAY